MTMNRAMNVRRGLTAATAYVITVAAMLLTLGLQQRAFAQEWTTSGNDINNTNSGNVRVGGGPAPTAVLHTRGNLSSPLTGTVSATQNSAAVTGTGTSFTSELAAGDSIRIGSEIFTVASVASNTSLTLDSNYLGATASGLTAYRDPNIFAVDNGDGVNKLTINRRGFVGIGTTNPKVKLHVSGDLAVGEDGTSKIRPRNFGGAIQIGSIISGGNITNRFISLGVNDNLDVFTPYLTTVVGGNVGVGTTSPAYKLDVVGQVRSSSGGFVFPDGTVQTTAASAGGGTVSAANVSAGQFGANTGGGAYTFSGSVAARTATPSDGFVSLNPGDASNMGYVNWFRPSSGVRAGYMGYGGGSNLALNLENGSTFSVLSGNVGVGTASPARRLHVFGGNVEHQFSTTPGQGYGFFISRDNNHFVENAYFDGTNWRAIRAGKSAIIQTNTSGGDALLVHSDDVARSAEEPRNFGQIFNVKTDGKVGLGTAAPEARLNVLGDFMFGGTTDTTATGYSLSVRASGSTINSGNGRGLTIKAGDSDNGAGKVGGNLTLNPGAPVSPATAYGNVLLATNGGNVGIGTASPSSKLQIVPTVDGDGIRLVGTNGYVSPGYKLYDNTTFRGALGLAEGGGGWSSSAVTGDVVLRAETGKLHLQTGGGAASLTISSGNVGIGIPAPNYKLDVQGGQINASGGLCIAGVCKTDWTQVGGGGSSGWNDTGASVSLANSADNVGIGIDSPATKLHVAGGTRVDGSAGRVYVGAGAAVGARGLEFIEENATTFAIRHHDPNVAWRNIAINPYGGSVGIGTPTPSTSKALHVVGDVEVSGNIAAKYQDVAEWVPSTQKLSAGTVVVLDAGAVNHVIASTTAYDTAVAGVVSEQPGLLLGEGGEGKVKVATTGRVKVKVDATRAPIKIGDLLVSGETPGVAMKSEPIAVGSRKLHAPGTIIGKALEPLDKGVGEILVLLSLQ